MVDFRYNVDIYDTNMEFIKNFICPPCSTAMPTQFLESSCAYDPYYIENPPFDI